MYGIIVGGGFHIADYAEGNREVRAFHQGKFQLQGVVLAMGVVDKNILFRDAVLAELHHFQPEAFLHQSVFVVLAEEHGLAMSQIDGVFGAVFFLGNGIMRAVIEDDAVLENLADAGSFVVVGGFQDFHCSGCIRGNGACKEVAACTEAEFRRMERVFYRTVRR